MSWIPFVGSSGDENKGGKGKVPGNSSDGLPGYSSSNHTRKTPEELMDIRSAKGLNFTDKQVQFSVERTQSSMNVSKSALLNQFDKDASRVSSRIEEVVKKLPSEDTREVKDDIVKTENSGQHLLVNANISRRKKAIVAAEILEEVAEEFKDLTKEMFELKLNTTDTNFQEKKPEFKGKVKEAHNTAKSSIELYYLIKNNTDPDNSGVISLANDAADLYKNAVKAFSAVCRDAGGELGKLEKKVGGKSDPEVGRRGTTVFETFFEEPLR